MAGWKGNRMGAFAVTGAMISCTMGGPPGVLIASQGTCMVQGRPIATARDVAPITNIGSCGMCKSMANPAVASATAAALGVLTPQPCMPAPAGIWIKASHVLVAKMPALTKESRLICGYGGEISIIDTGQQIVKVK